MDDITRKVCKMIVNRLELEDLNPEDMDCSAALFKENGEDNNSLELDSVDALELVVGLREEFAVTVTDEDMYIFESIDRITEFVKGQKSA